MRIVIDDARIRRTGWRDRVLAAILLGGMAGMLAVCAWLIAGLDGIGVAVIALAAAMVLVPRLPPGTVMRWHRGRAIDPQGAPDLYAMLEVLSRRGGITTPPALYWLPERSVDAFTVGEGGRAAIGLSDGALGRLPRRALRAVLAHEIAHVAAGDTGWLRMADGIAQLTGAASLFGLAAGLLLALTGSEAVPPWSLLLFASAPSAAALLQLALSRNREFAADLAAVRLTGDPLGMIVALQRIDTQNRGRLLWWLGPAAGDFTPVWLRTHPPIRERVDRLLRHVHAAPGAGLPPIFWFGEDLSWEDDDSVGLRLPPRFP